MAGDSASAVQQAIRAELVADASVAALVSTRVVSTRRDGDDYPLIVFGDHLSSPYDGEALDGEEHFISLHGWDDNNGNVGRALNLKAAMRNALHCASLTVSGHTAVNCRVTDSRLLRGGENDRLAHVFMRLRVVTH